MLLLGSHLVYLYSVFTVIYRDSSAIWKAYSLVVWLTTQTYINVDVIPIYCIPQ